MTAGTQLFPSTTAVTSTHRRLWRSWLKTIVGDLIASIDEARRQRQAVRELHKLDDRTLADIGIVRSGIEAAVRGRDHDQWPRTIRKS